MLKNTRSILFLIPAFIFILSIATAGNAHANSCEVYFPSPLSSNLQNSAVYFDYDAEVNGTDGSIAIGIGNDGTSDSKPSCKTQKCVDSNVRTPELNFPAFQTQSSNDSRTTNNNETLHLPQGAYQNIVLGWKAEVHFTNNNQVTYIQHLNSSQSQTELTFEEGVYWIDTLSLGYQTKINVNGNDKVVLFVNNANFNQSTVRFNQQGQPEQLVVVLYQPTTFGYRVTIDGFLIALDSMVIGNEANIIGAIHGNNVRLNYRSKLTYAQSSVGELDFDEICSGQEPTLPEPVADFRFDRTYWKNTPNDVLDSSSNQIHGTITEDVAVFEQGQVCRAATFDGTSDYIETPGIENYLRNTATLAFWIKTSQLGNNTAWNAPGVIGIEQRGGENDIFWGIIDASGRIGFQKGNGNQAKSTNPINDDNWHHVAFTWNENTGEAKAYIDGVLNHTTTTETGAVTTSFSSIGRIVDSFSAVQFTGQLDEFNVYDQILSSSEIKNIYDQQVLGKNIDGSDRVCPIEAQAGQVTLYDTSITPQFTKVCFDREFSVPPKIFTLGQTNNDDRLVLRIKNVTTQGFEIAQVESEEKAAPIDQQPAGNISQTVDYLAIVEGVHTLAHGNVLKVATHNTTSFQGNRASGSKTWDTISIADMALTETPVVIANLQTLNNESHPFPFSEPFMTTTIENVSNQQFRIALERAETNEGSIVNTESIAYLATNANNLGQLNRDIQFESFVTTRSIEGANTCTSYTFDSPYGGDLPLIIASQTTRNGNNGGWAARCSLSSSEVGFSILEDRDHDSEGGHVKEIVSGLALSGRFSNQTCGVVYQDIHHYRIEHDGHGLTCDAESMTVKACLDASCDALSSRETSVELTLGGESKSLVTFTGSDVATFDHTTAETATLDIINPSIAPLNPVICDTGTSSSCDIAFNDAGFRFLNVTDNSLIINNQIAGIPFPDGIKIQAVENDNGVCSGIFNTPQAVAFAQENVNPGGATGLSFEIDGNDIAKYANNNTTEITLTFDSDSSAILPNALYNDAGQIRLRAFYDNNDIQLQGSSNAFWVAPANFVIRATKGGVALNGNSSVTSVTQAAGDDFELTVQALNAASPAQITQNYQPGQMQFSLRRVLPTISGSADGQLTIADGQVISSNLAPIFQNANITNFNSGNYIYSNARFSEVGILELDVKDSDYANAGITIDSDAIALGRFIPAYLTQQVAQAGSLLSSCDGRIEMSAFSGQKQEDNASIGAISYLSNPVLKITAYNAQGVITQNYHQDTQASNNDFMKLDASDINIIAPTLDLTATGIDGSALPVVSNLNTGTLSQNDLIDINNTPLSRGVLHYQLSSNDNFYYVRSANAEVEPFQSNLQFNLANSFDSDGVAILNTQPFIPTGLEIRFGRIALENIFGPETHDLGIDMTLQHYENGRFVKSSDNSCPSLSRDYFSLTSMSLDAALTGIAGNSTHFNNGAATNFYFTAPGENNMGNLLLTYDSFEWLKYDWNNTGSMDQNPTAEATFGIYKGDQRLLFWRESQ